MVRVHPELVRFRKFDWVFILANRFDFAHALRDPLEFTFSKSLAFLGLAGHYEPRTAQVGEIRLSVIRFLLPDH